jgi:hypothetical protein
LGAERKDFLRGGQIWIDEGGCRSLLDLINRNRAGGKETQQNGDAAWDAALPATPTAEATRPNVE